MTDVAIIGVGQTAYGRFPTHDAAQLGAEAVVAAVLDAGVRPGELGQAWCGMAISGLLDGQENVIGQLTLREAGMAGLPVARVENACSSGSVAFQQAVTAIASGACEVALAFGIEKMTDRPTGVVMEALSGAGDRALEGDAGMTFPVVFALVAKEHMRVHGTPREALAHVAVKAHRFGASNPKAHLRNEVTISDVLDARPVADPLGVLDCCPISDGAAAVVLASRAYVQRNGVRGAAWIRSSVLGGGTMAAASDLTGFEVTRRLAATAYDEAAVGPEDIDVAEVHDCFTIAEIVHIEDLGFFPKGAGGRATMQGETELGGRVVVNPSGGLKAKGHPVGATGVGQLVELVGQLRGDAGDRQASAPRLGLAHCMGGFYAGDAASLAITIVGSEPPS